MEELSSKIGINSKKILELTKLTDVSRIKLVDANFARVLVDSSYNTVKKVAKDNICAHNVRSGTSSYF